MEILVYRQGADRIEEGFKAEDLPELLANKQNIIWVDLQGETPQQAQEAKDILLNVFKFHYLTVIVC